MATFNANSIKVTFTQQVSLERDPHSGLLTGRIITGEMQSSVHKLAHTGKPFVSFSITAHPRIARLLLGSPVEWIMFRTQRHFSRN